MAHFQIENLTFSYAAAKGKHSLQDVNLTIEKGEYIVLCWHPALQSVPGLSFTTTKEIFSDKRRIRPWMKRILFWKNAPAAAAMA